MKHIWHPVWATGVVLAVSSGLVQALPTVTWSTSDVFQATDIKNDGTLVIAADVNDGSGSGVTVNGMLFVPADVGGNNGTFGNNLGGQNDADLSSLFNTEQWGVGDTVGGYTIAGAVPGQTYRAQILSYVSNFEHDTDVTIEGVTWPAWDMYHPWANPEENPGSLLEATWVQEAGDTTIDFAFERADANGWTISGFAVHIVPEPGALWLALLGAWGIVGSRRWRR